jgi:hypothetical protein
MRILIDACVDPRICVAFPGHEVSTAAQMGWHHLSDNALVEELQGRFDVLVTIDQGFEFQQDLNSLEFGLLIIRVERNKLEYYRPLFQAMLAAAENAQPGKVVHVGRAPTRV